MVTQMSLIMLLVALYYIYIIKTKMKNKHKTNKQNVNKIQLNKFEKITFVRKANEVRG